MKPETYLNAYDKAKHDIAWMKNWHSKKSGWFRQRKRRERQRDAFRSRILRMFEDRDTRIVDLEVEIWQLETGYRITDD